MPLTLSVMISMKVVIVFSIFQVFVYVVETLLSTGIGQEKKRIIERKNVKSCHRVDTKSLPHNSPAF